MIFKSKFFQVKTLETAIPIMNVLKSAVVLVYELQRPEGKYAVIQLNNGTKITTKETVQYVLETIGK